MLGFLLLIVVAALVGWLIATLASGRVAKPVRDFQELLTGWPRDAWPHGVQEEDRDRRWDSAAADHSVKPTKQTWMEPSATAIATGHVKARTRTR